MINNLKKLPDLKMQSIIFSLGVAISSCCYAESYVEVSEDCGNAISQTSINICTAEQVDAGLEFLKKQIVQYKGHWSQESQKAFQDFEKARDQFVSAHLENETDWPTGTTGRAEAYNEEQLLLIKDESIFLARFEQGRFPEIQDSDYEKYDKQLNSLYKTIQYNYEESDPPTGVTRQSIKKTQLIWLRYRDAWANFAQIQYPKLSSLSWKAFVTKKRVAMLEAFK